MQKRSTKDKLTPEWVVDLLLAAAIISLILLILDILTSI